MRPIPPHLPWKSGHKSKLKVVLAVERRETFLISLDRSKKFSSSSHQQTKNDKCRYLFIRYSDPTRALKDTAVHMMAIVSVKNLLLLAV